MRPAPAALLLALFIGFTATAQAEEKRITLDHPLVLADAKGKTVTSDGFPGQWLLVYFGYTHCADQCPTALSAMVEALDEIGPAAAQIQPLFVTVDPERDTAAALKDYLASFDPHVHGLTGDPAALAAVAKAYRVYYKKVPLDGGDYTMDHTAIVYLMDKEGHFVSPFSLKRKPEVAAAELRKYL